MNARWASKSLMVFAAGFGFSSVYHLVTAGNAVEPVFLALLCHTTITCLGFAAVLHNMGND